MKLTYLILLFILVTPHAYSNECVSRALKQVLTDAEAELLDTLKSRMDQLDDHIQKIIKPEKIKKDKLRANDLTGIEELDREILALQQPVYKMNDQFVKDTSVLLKSKGIPHTITTEDELLILHLNLEQVPVKNHAFDFYAKIKKKYGVKKFTLSIGDTAPRRTIGFYQSREGRIELGYREMFLLMDEKAGVTAKHEIRHAIFNHKKVKNEPSSFQINFFSKDNKYLNDKLMYDEYMSAEEIYNWSTDLHTYAQKIKGATPEDVAIILNKAASKNKSLTLLAETGTSVSDAMIENLNKMIKNNDFSQLQVRKGNVFLFTDRDGRITSMTLVGPERVKLYKDFQTAKNDFDRISSYFVRPELARKGITNPESEIYMSSYQKLTEEFILTPGGQEVYGKLMSTKRELAQYAIEQLNDLKTISQGQTVETTNLKALFDKFNDPVSGGKPEQLDEIKKQMFKIAKNVKENYKDSILNRARRGESP